MLSDYETLMADLARDDGAKLNAGASDRAIAAAVERYSKDRPLEAVEDLTPASANLLPLPAAWVVDFSALRQLEYPIGNVPPTHISRERTSFYRSPAALQILLQDAVNVAAANVRATYTVKHQLDGAHDTIPLGDRVPVCCWAAASLCDQLATFYSSDTDSTIQADSVQQRSKAQEYAARAKTLYQRYLDELGIDPKRSEPAGAFVTQADNDSFGAPRQLHPGLVR